MTKQDLLIIIDLIERICEHYEIVEGNRVFEILYHFIEKSDKYGRYSVYEQSLYSELDYYAETYIKNDLRILTEKGILICEENDLDKYYTLNYDKLNEEIDL